MNAESGSKRSSSLSSFSSTFRRGVSSLGSLLGRGLHSCYDWSQQNRLLVSFGVCYGSYYLFHRHYHCAAQDCAAWRRVESAHDSEHCPRHAPDGAPFVSRFEYVITRAGDIVQTCVFYPTVDQMALVNAQHSRHRKTQATSFRPKPKAHVLGDAIAQTHSHFHSQKKKMCESEKSEEIISERKKVDASTDSRLFKLATDECMPPSIVTLNLRKGSNSSELSSDLCSDAPAVVVVDSDSAEGSHRRVDDEREALVASRSEVPVVRGIIYYCHGYGASVSGNDYWHLAKIAAMGYGVVCVEYPNHGLSDGLFCYISSWNNLIDSVRPVYSDLREKYWPSALRRANEMPTFLFGISMGGAVALYLMQRMKQETKQTKKGSTLSGEGVDVKIETTTTVCGNGNVVVDSPQSDVSEEIECIVIETDKSSESCVFSDAKSQEEEEDSSNDCEEQSAAARKQLLETLSRRSEPMPLKERESESMADGMYGEDVNAVDAAVADDSDVDCDCETESELKGLILLSPMCHISEEQRPHPIVERALGLMAYFMPTFPITPSPDGDNTKWEFFATHNSEATQWLKHSPLYFTRKTRLGTAIQLLNVTANISENIDEFTSDLSVPLLVQHGSLDAITDPRHSKFLFGKSKARDKTLIIYQNQFHKLFLEPELKDAVFNDMDTWLWQHSLKRSEILERYGEKQRTVNKYIFRTSTI